MKRFFFLIGAAASLLQAMADEPASVFADENRWQLEWSDEFNGPEIDPAVWGRVSRGISDWQNTQSADPRLYDLRDGLLVLRGIVNDNLEADTAHHLTGGLWTKDLKYFAPGGRIAIRARLNGAKGAWPAFWLLPYDYRRNYWPKGGEIDIMERLNHDEFAYQTVHSNWTLNMGHADNPPHFGTQAIDADDFNVYSVDLLADSLVFKINGRTTFSYPCLETEGAAQYPFFIDQYLLIDMQLGGSWVGAVDDGELPVEMEIDWVRYYRPKE